MWRCRDKSHRCIAEWVRFRNWNKSNYRRPPVTSVSLGNWGKKYVVIPRNGVVTMSIKRWCYISSFMCNLLVMLETRTNSCKVLGEATSFSLLHRILRHNICRNLEHFIRIFIDTVSPSFVTWNKLNNILLIIHH